MVSITTTSAFGGSAGSRSSGRPLSKITGEQHVALPPIFFQFKMKASRPKDVAGINEGDAYARCKL